MTHQVYWSAGPQFGSMSFFGESFVRGTVDSRAVEIFRGSIWFVRAMYFQLCSDDTHKPYASMENFNGTVRQ